VPAIQGPNHQKWIDMMKDQPKDSVPVVLHGATAIARFLYGDDPGGRRRVYHLTTEVPATERLPVFRMGDVICARRETLLTWIADREGRTA
jgi:hypothetical protein